MTNDMKYCINCGNEMKRSEKFCGKCGALSEVEATENPSNNRLKVGKTLGKNSEKITNNPHIEDTYIPMGEDIDIFDDKKIFDNFDNKQDNRFSNMADKLKSIGIFKKKNLIIAGIVVILLFLGNSFMNKEQTRFDLVTDLKSAIVKNDEFKLKRMIKSSDDRLKIDNEVIDILINYYNENPSQVDSDMEDLLSGDSEYSPFEIERRKVFLKDTNVVVLQPRYISVDSSNITEEGNDIEVEVKHGEDVIKTADGFGEIGPLAPGNYTINLKLKNEYVEKTEAKEVDIFNYSSKEKYEVDIFSDLLAVTIESNKPDAIVYIDGKSTEKKIKDIGTIVGLQPGSKIYAMLKDGDKTIKSETYEVDEYGFCNLYFEESKEEKVANIESFIEDYEEAYQSAINDGEFRKISPYLLYDSYIYDDYKDDINLYYERNIKRYMDSYEVTDIEEIDEGIYTVVVVEKLNVDRNGEVENHKYRNTFTIGENTQGGFYISDRTEEAL